MNLTAESVFLNTLSLAKPISWLSKDQYFSYVKCSENICSGLRLVKSTLFWLVFICKLSEDLWETIPRTAVESVSHTASSAGRCFQGQPVNHLTHLSGLLSLSINQSHNRSHSHYSSVYLILGGFPRTTFLGFYDLVSYWEQLQNIPKK